MEASSEAAPITDEWCARHFDHISPELAQHLHETLAKMRADHPVTWSEEYGGFWVVTRYEDVLRVAQDWRTFSSAHGVSVPDTNMVVKAIPEHVDPPLHRTYRRLINAYFTPTVVAGYEPATRDLVTRLIDDFIEAGECDFMAAFARPFPGLAFFEMALNAPSDEVERLAELSTTAVNAANPNAREAWQQMYAWITEFVAQRREQPPQGDVVDAVLHADIDGRPITEDEIIGIIQLLILGGLDTTAGALGQWIIRFAREPEIPALLRDRPELIPDAVEELLRLEPPFIAIARTCMADTEIGGQRIRKGDKVLIYWASANRDEDEFTCPHEFDLGRERNRHLAFGAGPHRCAGSNLARMNLRIALQEITRRITDIQLAEGAEPIPFHSVLNRAPLTLPITFTPGPRVLAGTGSGART
ncbi:MAG TPA: cytochrome P450 [Acidimicrobiales bacterium]